MLILITYERDPSKEGEADRSAEVQAAIDKKASEQIKPLTGLWLAETDEDVDAWASFLAPFAEPGRLLVARVQGRTNGLLPPETWEWINARAS